MDILLTAGIMLIGIVIGFLPAFLKYKTSVSRGDHELLSTKYRETETALQVSREKIILQNESAENIKISHRELLSQQVSVAASLQAENTRLVNENSRLNANLENLSEKMQGHKEEIAALQQTAHLQFEKIANRLFEEKSGKFTEANRVNIEALLKPLGENIEHFKKKVEDTYDKESKQRFSLEEKVKELVEQTNKVSAEANNLAAALKGESKKQGNWGEIILESILQNSGLAKDREYFLQQTIKDDTGRSLRPDVLVKLPDNRTIIIDSKVSLTAYDRWCGCDDDAERAKHLTDHLRSIRNHVDELQGKKYDMLESSLDFTMMFVPIEPAYLISVQHDQNLWSYAYSKRIMLISPTNLIACLKLMSDLWKREQQSRNAMEIVNRGEKLYEKFVSFTANLEEVGKHIDRTQKTYEAAMSQLQNGSGNLISQAVKLKSLGLKSNKDISTTMLNASSDLDVNSDEKIKPDLT